MKTNMLLPVLVALALMSCGGQQTGNPLVQTASADTLNLKADTPDISLVQADSASHTPFRKLRYMYASHGGLLAFFDDGTVSACSPCEMIKENVSTLYETKPHARYKKQNNSLSLNGDRMDFYKGRELKPEWVLFEYKWTIKIFPRK